MLILWTQISDLPKIAAMIQSLDLMEQTTAVSQLRRLLSLGNADEPQRT